MDCRIALVVILVIGTIASRFFLVDMTQGGINVRWGNILNILVQASVIGILAVGMTYVILTAGIDLSVGSVIALAGVAAATFGDFGAPVMVIVGVLDRPGGRDHRTGSWSPGDGWCRSSRPWRC